MPNSPCLVCGEPTELEVCQACEDRITEIENKIAYNELNLEELSLQFAYLIVKDKNE